MKKIHVNEDTFNRILLKESFNFDEVASATGLRITETNDDSVVMEDENVIAVIGIDEGDGSELYRPQMFLKEFKAVFENANESTYQDVAQTYYNIVRFLG